MKINDIVEAADNVQKKLYTLALGTYFRDRICDRKEREEWAWTGALPLLAAAMGNDEQLLQATRSFFDQLYLQYAHVGSVKVGFTDNVLKDNKDKVKALIESALEDYRSDMPNRCVVEKRLFCSLRVYDSQGRVTGLVNGDMEEEIPNSVYDDENKMVEVFFPDDEYHYEVLEGEEGTYWLEIVSIQNGQSIVFAASNIPTSVGSAHLYFVDWMLLSRGGEGVTVQVDSNGDGVFERSVISDNELTRWEFLDIPQQVPVGGEWIPKDELQLLAPWISSVSLMMMLAASFVYIRHKKKQQN